MLPALASLSALETLCSGQALSLAACSCTWIESQLFAACLMWQRPLCDGVDLDTGVTCVIAGKHVGAQANFEHQTATCVH